MENYYLASFYLLKKFHLERGEGITFFHLNFHYSSIARVIRKLFPDSKIFLTIHFDLGFSFENKYIDLSINTEDKYNPNRIFYNYVDKVICLSKYNQDLLIKKYAVDSNKIYLIRNGMSDSFNKTESRNSLREKYGISDSTKVFIFVGRLDKIKGVDILIESFRYVYNQNRDFLLFVVGNGEDICDYLRLTYKYHKNIVFTGYLSKEDIHELYIISDIGILPSFYEQCSYTVIEMLMYGLPVIGTNAIGLDEMPLYKKIEIENSKINPILLSEVIIQSWNFKIRKESIRNVYISNYDLSIMKKKILSLYRDNLYI